MSTLVIDGEVRAPCVMAFEQLAALPSDALELDVGRLVERRTGDAVRLSALLARVQPTERATHLTLHASADDFHASIPLDQVADRGLVVFRREGAPLDAPAGGPFRFLIVDAASCRAHDVDTCANVKFVDRLELTSGKGDDNRPPTPKDHRKLHDG